MKKTKILIPALSILALGMAASVTGTVAWFTQNAVATATGIAVKSKVPSALYISDELHQLSEGDSLTLDSVSHSAAAIALDPTHMTFAANTLTTNSPSAWDTEPSQGQGGIASAYAANANGALQGKVTSGDPDLAEGASFATYAKYVEESIVRKKTDSQQLYDLIVDVTINNIDTTNSDEATAYLTLRVGFMWSVDGGTTWQWTSKETSGTSITNHVLEGRDSGRPSQTTPSGDVATAKSAVYQANMNITNYASTTKAAKDNEVINVVPVVWLEGSDSFCYAKKFQKVYNWTIDLSYHTTDVGA